MKSTEIPEKESLKKPKKRKKNEKFRKKNALGYRQGEWNVVDYFSPANERRRESSLSAEPVAGRKDRKAVAVLYCIANRPAS